MKPLNMKFIRNELAKNAAATVIQKAVRRSRSAPTSKFFKKVDAGPEQKTYDFLNTGTVADNVGQTQNLLSAIAQGTNIGQRVGLNIVIKSIQLHGDYASTAANLIAAGERDSMRLIVFVDKQSNGSSISTPQNLVYATGGSQTSAFTGRDPAYLDRFDVLYVEQLNLCSLGPNAARFDKFIKCNIPVRYGGSAASTPLTNAIYVGFTGTAPLANAGVCRFACRIQYTDE